MKINFQTPPKGGLDEKLIYQILKDYKMLNAEVLIRDEYATVDDFIDTIMIIDKKLLPLLASCCGRSFSVRVFIDTNCSEFSIPKTKKCSARNQVGVSAVLRAKLAIHTPTNKVLTKSTWR